MKKPKCIGKAFYVRVINGIPLAGLSTYGLAEGKLIKVKRYNPDGEYSNLCGRYFNIVVCNVNTPFFSNQPSYSVSSLTIPQDYCEFTNEVSVTKLMKEEEGW